MHEKKNLFIFEIFLIILIIFTPLFQGSVLLLPLSIFQLVSFILLTIFILQVHKEPAYKIIYPEGSIFIIIFIIITLFQLIPLPYIFLKIISPKTAEFYRDYLPDFTSSGLYPLSLYALPVKQELIKFISFFAIFIIALNTIKRKEQFERLFLIIIIWAATLSLYGVIRKYFILEKEISNSFSVFGNRNHFTAFMEMAVPLTLGYSLYCRDKFKKLLFGFIGTVISLSIFLSLSRGGSLSLIFSLALMVYLLKRDWVIQEKYWVLGAGCILMVILLSTVGLDPIKHRFNLLHEGISQRLVIVQDSFRIIKDFPFLGVGWGNFQFVFPSYRTFFSRGYYFYSHNDYLQLIVETGLIGFSFFFLFIFSVIRSIFKQLGTRKDPFTRSMVIGGLCGLFGVLMHSLVDFNFHITAVSFLFWLLLGLVYKCVFTGFRR